jgi:hypothetical protein
VFDTSSNQFEDLTAVAGAYSFVTLHVLALVRVTVTPLGARVDSNRVDLSARSGYSLAKAKPQTPHASAAEYYQVYLFRLRRAS